MIQSKQKGHLSNERHLSKEKRDWVAEVELQNAQPGCVTTFGIRRWRDQSKVSDFALNCQAEAEISFCLKRVAMWAEPLSSRMHFEWVWNGQSIRIVQADIADPVQGANPTELLPASVPKLNITGELLSAFTEATPKHFRRYKKLANAKLYRDMGYAMPAFLVLDNPHVLAEVISGKIPQDLRDDLAKLTKRPLILRTDGHNIPAEKQEMLPRSDELRTAEQAVSWVLGAFRDAITKNNLENTALCLIGHHFIPSVASAWARAEPKERFVRIEALWGLPEGLYWYAHDTFEVDTQRISIPARRTKAFPDYKKARERLRCKGRFVAADKSGKWIAHRTGAPFDWRPTISKRQWLFEIAQTTRLVAEREKHPVAVMWFIGNHRQATGHPVLPWYHRRSDIKTEPKAAPRRKSRTSQDFKLHTVSDWENLKANVASGAPVERVIVEPTDCDLIRDPLFTRELGQLAASHKIVIELAGGVLTHAFYILQRQGAHVEFTDLIGTEEEIAEYNKLVRDKIPKIIRSRGERGEVVRLRGDALLAALRHKLVEEAFEALDARLGHDLVRELADIEEVVAGLRKALQVSTVQVRAERQQKRKRRGGFECGYMLLKTATPHSLQKHSAKNPTLEIPSDDNSGVIIIDPTRIPTSPVYRRPDLRRLEPELEKLFAFETELNRLTSLAEEVHFSLPIKGDDTGEYTLVVEIRRNKSTLRTNVRLRLRPTEQRSDLSDAQLSIEFPQ
ncbi:MAG: nucleoside triphosphate pyrophosphohydrolase [Acidobacteria bacterium]|nr:nucleoside triphosphate pyrophosphohydrolase [Acidobacteriota bacterium]